MKNLGFGLMRLPLKTKINPLYIDIAQVKKMADEFLDRGFTYFDTAYMYHGGKSESAVKKVLVDRHPRESFTVTTKLPVGMMHSKDDRDRIFKKQLSRCGVDYFDYYLLHDLGTAHYKVAEELDCFSYIQRLKQDGLVKKIGFSYHDKADLLDRILTEHPEIEFVQLQMNYLDWESDGIQSRKCYETARKHGKPVIVMEPVKGGTLASVPPQVEEMFKNYNPNASAASWAVRFAASHEGVFMVLSGMSNMQQMLDNTSFMTDFKPFNDEEFEIVERAVGFINGTVAIPCTGCGYCTAGCPKNIPIPQYFSLYNSEKQALNKMFSTQRDYYANLKKEFGKASDCIGCKQCERACPQHLPITKYLKDVSKKFDRPF